MAKKYICPGCEKGYATRQSLWKHKQRCQYTPRNRVFNDYADTKNYSGTVAVKSPIDSPHKPENPRIRNLLEEIANGDSDRLPEVHEGCSIVPSPPPTIVYSPIKKPPQPPPTKTPKPIKILPKPLPKLLSSPPRSIAGYSSDEISDEESVEMKPPKIKLLPATVDKRLQKYPEQRAAYSRNLQKRYTGFTANKEDGTVEKSWKKYSGFLVVE